MICEVKKRNDEHRGKHGANKNLSNRAGEHSRWVELKLSFPAKIPVGLENPGHDKTQEQRNQHSNNSRLYVLRKAHFLPFSRKDMSDLNIVLADKA